MEYDVFLSHASEDKPTVVRPLAAALRERGLKVWLDESELILGDRQRQKSELGLANSQHGIVILSHNFFAKHWTQHELDGLFARDVNERKVILPVYHGVSHEQVLKRFPMLASRRAVSTASGIEHVADEIVRAVAPKRQKGAAKKRSRKIRLYSSPESEAAGEVTWLSIIETVIAMLIYMAIWRYTGSLLHMAFAGVVAPLLLLRTDASIALALDWFASFYGAIPIDAREGNHERENAATEKHLWGLAVDALIALPLMLSAVTLNVGSLVIRVGATCFTCLRHPTKSVQAIPMNWNRIVLCLDIARNPELLPGIEGRKDLSHWNAWESIRNLQSDKSFITLASFGLLIGADIVFFAPAYVYRWSIKGTAILYSPLIYIVRTSFPEKGATISERLRDFLHDPLTWLLQIYSLFMLILFGGKLTIHLQWAELKDWWESMEFLNQLNVFVVPSQMPPWQIAIAINACITLALFFVGHRAIRGLERGRWNPATTESIFGWAFLMRGLLSLFTIACLVYITVNEARLFEHLQQINLGPLFPWTKT